ETGKHVGAGGIRRRGRARAARRVGDGRRRGIQRERRGQRVAQRDRRLRRAGAAVGEREDERGRRRIVDRRGPEGLGHRRVRARHHHALVGAAGGRIGGGDVGGEVGECGRV